MTTVVRTHQQEVVELPRDKSSVQKMLRRHGMKGLAVNSVEEPRQTSIGGLSCAVARVYCVAPARLASDDTMKRRACTVVFVCPPDDQMVVRRLEGWVVRDLGFDDVFVSEP